MYLVSFGVESLYRLSRRIRRNVDGLMFFVGTRTVADGTDPALPVCTSKHVV